MKASIKYLVMTVVLMISLTSHSESVRDGGMSGGGGGASEADPATVGDINTAIFAVRTKLYLYFNKLTWGQMGEPRIDNIKYEMLNIIEKTSIYTASEPCQDKFGEPKDGSIYAPYPNAICISLKNLQKRLRKDNVTPQVTALVAHEYAHLAGLGEIDAMFVQDWVLHSFSYGMGDFISTLEAAQFEFGKGVGYLDRATTDLSWNSICYASEEVEHMFATISRIEESGIYRIFDFYTDKLRNSYRLKTFALKSGACGLSNYHPDRVRLARNYANDFGNKTEMTAPELEQTMWGSDGSMTLDSVVIRKFATHQEALRELNDVLEYTKTSLARVKMIRELTQSPLK